ncbi:prolyl 4-hydroxylase subunit alpha [Pedobacter frigiditerrae]|uniref:Prolyl 4-hydroxylase subunit alpha n=1 Tax=Pedobacter frigiditerrae TaxID=2530452 RepID=A0A4R0MZ81_9SPHI|nr:2OG-Fe(II) oxygenase [Pedobacter frigiditerrae]TCC91582.1 prolyl 4-hydroxylase subunit alpha [Pedobacter frigiditerrae]
MDALFDVRSIDSDPLAEEMNQNGYAIINNILTNEQCNELIKNYNQSDLYRKTVVMERYRFGLGEYKYFNYPLPDIITSLRQNIYPLLAPIANNWMKALNIPISYPIDHDDFLKRCHDKGQTKATPLILKYGKGGFNTLHQDLYGDIYFPIQMVLFLNDAAVDYTGGEFVLIQQNVRAQSKAIVLKPKKGDILIFTTNFRPVKGSKGYYSATMKHGVSELHSGERYTLGIIFHDALS